MKKFRLSLAVVLAVVAGSAFAVAPNLKFITPGWYGQTVDAPSPYNMSHFIPAAQLNAKCPQNPAHLCAVLLKSDGTLDNTQSPNTRTSSHNYQP
jgi:hypothetical protein